MNLEAKLKFGIRENLPGESAHLAMSPTGRNLSSEALKSAVKVKESAVAIHIFDHPESPRILLTKRSDYRGTHGGQISFPGGKMEPDDIDMEHTARRESFEETGIGIGMGLFCGKLTEIFIPVSTFRVHPFVIYHPQEITEFKLSEREVAEVFSMPFSVLTNNETVKTVDIQISSSFTLPNVPCYEHQGYIIWGATAIILNELKVLLKTIGY
jgi:8-oxo-dGTP pyrophosphatase MutT (NUDIX family)